ncbi:U1 zinc finger family protein [Tritrichomonas foetus]|uniref:U1 zinc finger family protein n=1 Tax=Tritrichomonas foetus TaxID=1144522 RepID=A0A1J4KU96_9EUKA|nr:U1 zinc finger family protein [Tritrichomonas foetus]|eukprot:OHT14839.1 U1 zinc finger family protein [Tritrichomonas foetus]
MGKKRAYCPYCDVYLVHNSLRSRRDHAIGWKHLASFQAYFARYLPQHFKNSANKTAADENDGSSTSQSSLSLNSTVPTPSAPRINANLIHPPPSIGISAPPTVRGIAPPPIAPIRPPAIGIAPPPNLSNLPKPANNAAISPPSIGAPPSIHPPPIAPPSIGPPSIHPPTIGPPSIRPPPIGPPTIGPPTIGPPSIGPPQIKPPVIGPPSIRPPVIGPPSIGPPKPSSK